MNDSQNIWGFLGTPTDYKFLSCGQHPQKDPEHYFFVFESGLTHDNIHHVKISSEEAESIVEAFPLAKDRVHAIINIKKSKYYTNLKTNTDTSTSWTTASDETTTWSTSTIPNFGHTSSNDFMFTEDETTLKPDWGQTFSSTAGESLNVSFDSTSIQEYITDHQYSNFLAPPTGMNIVSKDGGTSLQLQHGSVYLNGKKEKDA